MADKLPTILMLPPHGPTPVEQWMGSGRLAVTLDLLDRLKGCGLFDPIIAVADEPGDEASLIGHGAIAVRRRDTAFHFGETLAGCLEAHSFDHLAYFGGASAPLLTQARLRTLGERILGAGSSQALTNNLHSSDWFLTNDVSHLIALKSRFPSDNPLGWVYAHEAGVEVHDVPPSAATRLDIDTPMDFAMLIEHTDVGPYLSRFLQSIPPALSERVAALRVVLRTPAKNLSVIGRASAGVWQTLQQRTQIWVRLFAEERGMVASRRLARGEVRSLVGRLVRELGPQGFIDHLCELSDAVLWDTRVWMAAELQWPDAGDRFAADLGRLDEIGDERLRDLTRAINEAAIPIVAGGYGVVSGGLYALLEGITPDDYQPTR